MEFLKWCRLQWDRVSAVAAVATGGILLVLGWAKVSGTPYAAEQIPVVVSCGLGGIFLLGLGAMLWHSADLRDQWRKLDRLEERFEAVAAGRAAPRPRSNNRSEGAARVELDDGAVLSRPNR
jgi:hypothetical protein